MKIDKDKKRQSSLDKAGLVKPDESDLPHPDLQTTSAERPAEFGEHQAAADKEGLAGHGGFDRQSALEKAGLLDPAEENQQLPEVRKARPVKSAQSNSPPSALEKAGLVNPAENVEAESTDEDTGLVRSTVPEYETSKRRGNFDQQRLRTDQVRLIQRQANTELVISMLVCAVVAIVLWEVSPACTADRLGHSSNTQCRQPVTVYIRAGNQKKPMTNLMPGVASTWLPSYCPEAAGVVLEYLQF